MNKIDLVQLRTKQQEIAQKAQDFGSLDKVKRFVAFDISNNRGGPLFAAAVILERGKKEILETASAMVEPDIPYIPGFLAFREIPAIEAALKQLRSDFDLFWVDGHGLTHPRRAGIATHLGVVKNKPSLGVAKKLLTGNVGALDSQAASSAPIFVADELRGFALRTRQNALPIFISAGHLCSPEAALSFVKEHLDGLRLPWPTRLAHQAANLARIANNGYNFNI